MLVAFLTLGFSSTSLAAFPNDFDDVVFTEEAGRGQTGLKSFVSNMAVTANLVATVGGNDGGGGQNVTLDYNRRTNWPAGGGNLSCCNANAWAFIKVGETWYAATWEFLRVGQTVKSSRALVGPKHLVFPPLNNYSPRTGDLVGFMVSGITRTGLARNNIRERSNVSFYRINVGPVDASEVGAPPAPEEPEVPNVSSAVNVLLGDD